MHPFQRAVTTHKPGCDRHREPVKIHAPGRETKLHLGLQRPRDVLQLRVAHLELVSDFNTRWICVEVFGDRLKKRLRDTQREYRVALIHLPPAWHARRDYVDIAVNRGAAVSLAAPATRNVNRWAQVDR